MEVSELKSTLEKIKAKSANKDWFDGLDERKRQELEFHNKNRDKSNIDELPKDTYELLHGNKKFYSTVEKSKKYVQDWLNHEVPGKVFLDYACGNGGFAFRAARTGAALSIGLDISNISIANCTDGAEKMGLSDKTLFLQGDCENTGLPDNCIDVIICSGMLHHLDLSYAFPELRRILKPGGKILAVEALDYNPLIKIYRQLTPSMRTEWEKNHILSLEDVEFAQRFFEVGEVKFWHVVSFFGAYLNKFPAFESTMKLLNGADAILTKLPFVKLLAWQFTFELIKPDEH